MIRFINIQNFKSLEDTDVELGPFNVFIGDNGAGKTSFFRALGFLRDMIASDSINAFLDARGESFNDIVSLRADSKLINYHCRLTASTPQGEDVDASFAISVRKRRFVYVHSESVMPWDRRGVSLEEDDIDQVPYLVARFKQRMLAVEPGSRPLVLENATLPHSFLRDVHRESLRRKSGTRFPRLSAVARSLLRYRHFEIWGPEALRRPSLVDQGRLGEDGSNLAHTLLRLRTTRREAFSSLLSELAAAYPWVDDIEFRRSALSEVSLAFVEKSALRKKNLKKYSAHQVSDGFLRMLALQALKHDPGLITTIAYEEPENGLHPQMISRAARALREIAATGTQVLVSTHSPLFISRVFEDRTAEQIQKELRLVRRDKAGRTTIRPPSIAVIQEALENGFSTGDLWTMLLGEDELAG
ncbi:MAG: AAA family ATPase [Phycisphaerales bacterium JB039]